MTSEQNLEQLGERVNTTRGLLEKASGKLDKRCAEFRACESDLAQIKKDRTDRLARLDRSRIHLAILTDLGEDTEVAAANYLNAMQAFKHSTQVRERQTQSYKWLKAHYLNARSTYHQLESEYEALLGKYEQISTCSA